MAKLSARVWENKKLTTQTKVAVYRACIVSTLLFGSESWTTYASQEKRLNIFHMRCLRRILSISWTDKVSNNEVLAIANIPSMFTLPTDNWELHAVDRSDWRSVCSHERKCLSQLRYSWTWSDDCLLLLLIHKKMHSFSANQTRVTF